MGGSSSRHNPQADSLPAIPTYFERRSEAPGPYFFPNPRPSYQPQTNGQFFGQFGGPHPPQGTQTPPFQYPGQSNAQPAAADKQLTQTATIRNAVNVKRSSLTVTPLPEDPTKLAVSFTFDASAPCIAFVLVGAKEDKNEACKLTPSKQTAAPGIIYDAGLKLQYPKEASQGAIIDLSLYGDNELKGVVDYAQYPLIIRLECISDKLGESHSLTELSPGAEQKVWVQSQTTFAQLSQDESGKWIVKALKQKIWVEGTCYELQEIYGIEQATTAAKDRVGLQTSARTAEQEEERLCVICLVNERDTTVLPCRHMCMCHECAQELRKQTSKCPICRNHVESLLHIRMTRQQAPRSASTPVDHNIVKDHMEKLKISGDLPPVQERSPKGSV